MLIGCPGDDAFAGAAESNSGAQHIGHRFRQQLRAGNMMRGEEYERKIRRDTAQLGTDLIHQISGGGFCVGIA